MVEVKKTLRARFKAAVTRIKGKAAVGALALTAAVATAGGTVAKATETASSSGISINFEPTQMFTYSNVIIDCLMPVVYITAGLSLGFTVIYALKSAFSSRM